MYDNNKTPLRSNRYSDSLSNYELHKCNVMSKKCEPWVISIKRSEIVLFLYYA